MTCRLRKSWVSSNLYLFLHMGCSHTWVLVIVPIEPWVQLFVVSNLGSLAISCIVVCQSIGIYILHSFIFIWVSFIHSFLGLILKFWPSSTLVQEAKPQSKKPHYFQETCAHVQEALVNLTLCLRSLRTHCKNLSKTHLEVQYGI
jgi:hypothetical protein